MRIENSLEASKLDQTIKPAYKIEGDENVMKEVKESDVKAKFILMSSVTDSVLKTLKTTTAKDILSSLKTRCGETTQAVEKQLSFKKKFLVNETRK
jgi:hypothetical protein